VLLNEAEIDETVAAFDDYGVQDLPAKEAATT
jgi:hypothetical protein